jgi:hypothetical protein
MYTWKCHNKTSFIAILNKQKCLSTMEIRKAKQVLFGGGRLVPMKGEEIRKEYRRVGILCTCV